MQEGRYRDFIDEFLPRVSSIDNVYKLFKGLGYSEEVIFDSTYKRRVSEFGFAKDEEEKIANIYTILSIEKKLNIFLVEIEKPINLTVRFLRYLAKIFSDHYLHFLLIVTSDFDSIVFLLPDFEKKEGGKLKLKIVRLQIDVTNLYYTDKQTIANLGLTKSDKDWRDIWLRWRDAFNIRRVTNTFFQEYAGDPNSVFFKIRNELINQNISRKDAHEFTLQLLNRIMFIYFVAKKRWLNNDPRFMRWYWQRYLKERNNNRVPIDSFYDKWLRTIFFEAFNNRFTANSDLPEDVNRILLTVPYLNGGLFREEEFDNLNIRISDILFREVFDFFERYNFTIREDLPFDEEVAVDPQMIGYVYESLSNAAEEIYDRNDLGIFYTPKVEVDFMCRRSLVEYLHNHLPNVSKDILYQLVFDEETDKVEKKLGRISNFWYDLEEKMDSLAILDPACGSGAFLVGMMNVLATLYKIMYRNISRSKPDFEIKKRIIGKSLYGVDVMPWAIHATELRLWLQLIIESEYEIQDLRTYPLLPNLNMNLRVGDSLVQEIGGLTLHLRDPGLSDKLRKKLFELKQEKENYINNSPVAKFHSQEEVMKEEIRLFSSIIEERFQFLEKEISNLKDIIRGVKSQTTLTGEKAEPRNQKEIKELEERIQQYKNEKENLMSIKNNLSKPEKKPFIWEIDFAEIFGEKAGFDIVIGNPPYVRHESISPPNILKEEVTATMKKEYKDKLQYSIKIHFPEVKKIDRKSDYYVYFYFNGLSLLNSKGNFCFITSNSWLDVGYGEDLQEFLIKYVPILAIYDNQIKRTFEHADINTIIVLFSAPSIKENIKKVGHLVLKKNTWPALSNLAKFVMFKAPYEEVISSKSLIDIDSFKKNQKTQTYRVFSISQEDLLKDGWEYTKNHDEEKSGRFKDGKYSVNKWGKFLRAPDIFFTILEKNKNKLTKLYNTANIRRGFTPGINDFFYLEPINKECSSNCLYVKNAVGWEGEIEKEFLKPVIKSPRECNSIEIDHDKLSYRIFICHKGKKELNGTKALQYILWGEIQKTSNGIPWHRVPTVSGRKNWYELHENYEDKLIIPRTFNDRYICYFGGVNYSDRFYGFDNSDLICFLNSTIFALFCESLAKQGLGLGALDLNIIELNKIPVLKIDCEKILKTSQSIFIECGIDPSKPIRKQEPKPLSDRQKLDDIIFSELNLTLDERREVYWAVCESIKNRLKKAESLKSIQT